MRPKAPKPGKRILLEHITPLWKRMGFTAKLTARNLFRYKVRLFMTVIGVAGCTALVLAAFGLLDSFEPLTKTQFDEIFKYDAIVIPKQSGSPEELGYVKKLCNDTGKVKSAMFALQEDVKLEASGDFCLWNDQSAKLTFNSTPCRAVLKPVNIVFNDKIDGLEIWVYGLKKSSPRTLGYRWGTR